jgi:uncharacterized protein YjgD (DUF1641 family)
MIKLHTQSTFSKEIEKLVKESKLGWLEAIMEFAAQSGIELESVPKLLSPAIKEQLKLEATNLNMLGRKPKEIPDFDDE